MQSLTRNKLKPIISGILDEYGSMIGSRGRMAPLVYDLFTFFFGTQQHTNASGTT